MSTRNKIMLLLAFPVLVLISALLLGETSDIELIPSSSTYSTGTAGTKALFLLLQELKLTPQRYRKAFRDLNTYTGTLIVADPQRVDFTKTQARNIETWVKKGNRLILFEFARSRSDRKSSAEGLLKALSRSTGRDPASNFGLKMKEFPRQPRKLVSASLPGFSEEITVSASGETRWHEPSTEWTVLAKDDSGPLLLMKRVGEGWIFACSDPGIISNRYIGREQNLRLALGLIIGKGRHAGIIFDEFHHGYRAEESFWTYVGSSVFACILLQIALGCAVFFYSKRAELAGRFKSLYTSAGRSKLEYVDSMANIFESCKADSPALEAILERFVGRVSRTLGVPVKNLNGDSISRAGVRLPGAAVDLGALIDDARKAMRSGEPSEILAVTRRLSDLESTMDRRSFPTFKTGLTVSAHGLPAKR